MIVTRRGFVGGSALLLAGPALARQPAVVWEDRQLEDPRDGRRMSVRIARPARLDRRRAPIVLSHGANGSHEGLVPLMAALARERLVAAPLHVDGETHPQHGKLDQREVWRTRLADMDQILPLALRLGGGRRRAVAMGHSYGALVAQALGGAAVFGERAPDPRIAAVVAISPPGPLPGFIDAAGWAEIERPMLVTTGDADVLPFVAPAWQAHLASFEASRHPHTGAWVGRGVDHYFGRHIQRLTREAHDQSKAFAALVEIAGRFVAATAEGDRRARRWLARNGPATRFPAETASFQWRDGW
jgi:hypothetical protein